MNGNNNELNNNPNVYNNQGYTQNPNINYESNYNLENSNQGSGEYINNPNVIFEGADLATPHEKVKYYVSTINKKALTFIIATILGVLLLLTLVLFGVSRYNASYKSVVTIPKIIYTGESNSVTVVSKGKKDVSKTKTIVKSADENIIYVVDPEQTGQNVTTTIIPVSEGKTKINVESTLGKKKMAKEEQEVTVCPAFNSSLLVNDHLSVPKNATLDLGIDFGDALCKEGITYETSDVSIMTVDKSGTIRGVEIGTAVLSIKKDNRVLTIPVTVTEKAVVMTEFEVIPSIVQLEVGDKLRLNVKSSPYDSTTNRTSFSGYDQQIIKISKGGVITALKSGATIIEVSPGFSSKKEILVYVGKDESINATTVQQLKFDKENFDIIEGTTEKIYPLFVPNNVNDKNIIWETSDSNVAIVKNGVVYGRALGSTTITAKVNNNVSNTATVRVKEIPEPILATSDKVKSDNWHTSAYELSFFNNLNSVIYKYGESENKTNNTANSITVGNDEQKTYYIISCLNNHCSKPVSYVSKVDMTKPVVQAVAGISKTSVKENNLQIALKDEGSQIEKWCVTDTNNIATCKWNDIEKQSNPVVEHKNNKNGIFYVFAKDSAGNESESYKFEITNIS